MSESPLHGLTYWWVDVFATMAPVSGNRLMVFVPATAVIDDEACQRRVAAEIAFSEVTFLVPDRASTPEDAGHYRARIFTPTGELGYAGHPTLGSAVVWALETAPMVERVTLTQRTAGAVVRVTVERTPGPIGHRAWAVVPDIALSADVPLAAVAEAVGVPAAALGAGDLAAAVVAGPTRQLLLPVDEGQLEALRPSADAMAALGGRLDVGLVYAFTPPTADGRVRARGFGPALGVHEDPATGSAAGYLGRYLEAHGRMPASGRVTIAQGEQVGRPSELLVERRPQGDLVLGGWVRTVARGALLSEFLA